MNAVKDLTWVVSEVFVVEYSKTQKLFHIKQKDKIHSGGGDWTIVFSGSEYDCDMYAANNPDNFILVDPLV